MAKELRLNSGTHTRRYLLFPYLFIPILIFLLLPATTWSQGGGRMLQIKAAFTYRFLLFTRWPEQASKKRRNTIRIGVIDNEALVLLFKDLSQKHISKKTIEVLPLGTDASPELLRSCQLLYISTTSSSKRKHFLKQVAGYPVLTISDTDSFLEQGGMIALFRQHNKVHFSVNRKNANDAGISFSSQMLKMATQIVESGNDS